LFSVNNISAVKDWLLEALSSNQHIHHQSLAAGQLKNGVRVRLQALGYANDGNVGVLLERLPERGEKNQSAHGIPEILYVIEWLEEGVVLFGANQEIRAVNSRFGQIVGLTPDELTRIKTLDDLITLLGSRTADPGAFAESWHSLARSTEGAVREELQLVHPYSRLLERATRPILDAKGALVGRVEIYRDLTAQRVFQSKLLQTDKLAELGQMVTGIAHELSNPLTSILGYAQRLLLRRDSAGDSQEARQIFQEAERASGILRQLLLSGRENRPERRRIALNQIVSRTLELQRFSLAADNIHVQLDLEPVLPFVQGDSGQLQQVLMNLLGNARQAIEEQGKGGTIRIKTMRVSEKRVLLEVSDDGPGIPQAIQARIFDPFFTTKPPGVGTGLGLSIVLGIVREHGGHVRLTSNLGQGTTFSIELPALATLEMPSPATGPFSIRPKSETLPASDYSASAQPAAALDAWAGTRVLVLEDEPTVARLIADVLEDAGLRVDMLLDSREALDRAFSEDYALVICDMKMPELDGEHFYQALARANHPLRDRFVFVTGDVLAAHTRDFLERNRLPYVAKPFRVEELTEKIHAVLEHTLPREPSHVSAAKNAARF
jgi:two-component system NtrC family sensor kinase